MMEPDTNSNTASVLIGPFAQLVTMDTLPLKGSLSDGQLTVMEDAGILIEGGTIVETGPFDRLVKEVHSDKVRTVELPAHSIGLPGFVDAHTHSCFAGSRAQDYALRNSGSSYLEIAQAGGGIWDTVEQTRKADPEFLESLLLERIQGFMQSGITTLEVKSGYGLSISEELKMLRVIRSAAEKTAMDLIPTCLAAHTFPRDFKGKPADYLEIIVKELLPILIGERLTTRLDAFVEQSAFSPEEIIPYLRAGKEMGFDLTLHADQFSAGGSDVAISCGAISADHLEASGPKEIQALANSEVIATALPGASLGLGCGFTPARALLDAGACLAIASDYNPGSAPMGDLLTQASILGAFEKLSNAEVLAGITFRAAAALGLSDRGRLVPGQKADIAIFHAKHYNEIPYHQGKLRPSQVVKNGNFILNQTR
ncbi:imidazolonepropionase [Robiginitalea aurantiaca]|uniref:Imidazolonepropionase n=1 Tax=Robiginitalea aurantiaca TaxID=3056915 RepID=A0ABT7WBQ8_9FLAO|nr:imidazolonepropionase [Robiginitalea aurantiaca]MDM9630343.1 imidazolonepropionase [Robiginitalea aurantiaca]